MGEFIPWNSQQLNSWAERYAEGQFIDLAGRSTHFVERGQGKPVVLIHGFNLDSNTWIKNLDSLASRFKVYAIDLWGQGLSTRQPLNYGYDLFAEQVRFFMEALNLQSASLVGHSMGGGTSIVFSLKNRDKVEKLVLLDSAGIPMPIPFRAKFFKLKGVGEFLSSLNTDRIRRINLEQLWVFDNAALTDDHYEKLIRCQKIEGSTEALLSILRRDFFNTLEDEIAELGNLDVPTLIVWGREDVSIPLSSAKQIHQLLPGSRLEILDNAGHLANFDRPEEFNNLVGDFLSN